MSLTNDIGVQSATQIAKLKILHLDVGGTQKLNLLA